MDKIESAVVHFTQDVFVKLMKSTGTTNKKEAVETAVMEYLDDMKER